MGNYSSALIPETEEFVSVAEKQNEQTAYSEQFKSELQSLFSELPHAHRRIQQPKISTLAAYLKQGLKVTLMMEEETNKIQSEGMNLSILQESLQETSHNGTVLPTAEAKSVPLQAFSSLLPKALSAVLHPAVPPGLHSDPRPSSNPEKSVPNLEVLQTELRDLKDQFEQMKSQHNKEIKLLMNELDEEKRIRLTLQMEIQRMKKHMSK